MVYLLHVTAQTYRSNLSAIICKDIPGPFRSPWRDYMIITAFATAIHSRWLIDWHTTHLSY